MTACPGLETLERGGPEVDDHLVACSVCRSLAELMNVRSSPGGLDDCARAELLISLGGATPLPGADALYLSVHLSRCPACRETAREPPAADELGLPCVPPETYSLGPEIGRGGMGRILSARDRRIGRAVALKEMLEKDPVTLARFEREARITARLQHPGIVSIYEVGRWPDGRPFYAMPLLPGKTLREAIAEATDLVGRLRLLPNLIAAADAIAYAHSRGVIHRDLTPSNILVGSFGETTVIDWGVAKELAEDVPADDCTFGATARQDAELTAMGTVVGTPAYIAPEQAEARPVDERADVYALGAVLFHVLTGRQPYEGLAATRVIDHLRTRQLPAFPADQRLPRDLVGVARKAMNPDPDRRHASAADLGADLRSFQAGERVAAYRYSARELAVRWFSRHLTLVVTSSVLLTLLAVAMTIAGVRILREQRRADDTSLELEQMNRWFSAMESSNEKASPIPPKGWFLAGSTPARYEIGVDGKVTWQGRPAAFLRSTQPKTGGFGTLMQNASVRDYRGKRLRFRAYVKTSGVSAWAGLWMRIEEASRVLAFDNMWTRPIKGTTDWTRHDVVLDVAPTATGVSFGVLMGAGGTVWLSGIQVEVVDGPAPGPPPSVRAPARNLDFSERPAPEDAAPGWHLAGSHAGDYAMTVIAGERYQGKPIAQLRSTSLVIDGFAVMAQTVNTIPFRGRRIRLAAHLRTEDVTARAGLWVRADASAPWLPRHNMNETPIAGTTPWRPYEVIIDVRTASTVTFGVLLSGTGTVSVSNVELEIIGPAPPSNVPPPRNLDFSE